MIGGISHIPARNRQVPAQLTGGFCAGLALVGNGGNVAPVGTVTHPASVSAHLFCTPSSSGQARIPNATLPVFFCANRTRHAFAHCATFLSFFLLLAWPAAFVATQKKEQRKGEAGCETYGFMQLLQYVPGLQPVAKLLVSKRLSAAVQGLSRHWPWTAIRCWALLQAQPATCCIASSSPKNADRLGGPFRAGSVDRRRLRAAVPAAHTNSTTRVISGLNPDMQNTASGQSARGGFLRSTTPKTKDHRCSIRS